MFYKRQRHYKVMQESTSVIWHMFELIGFVNPIITNELIKTAKVLKIGSQPFVIEQWFTGRKRK